MGTVPPVPEKTLMIAKTAPAVTPSIGRDMLQALTLAAAAGLGTALAAAIVVLLLAQSGA
jgi:hypothetical protein